MDFDFGPARELYDTGGFYDDGISPETVLEKVEDGETGARVVANIYSPAIYERAAPFLVSPCGTLGEVEAVCAMVAQAYTRVAPSVAVTFNRAYVRDSVIYSDDASGHRRVFYPTFRPSDRAQVSLLDGDIDALARPFVRPGRRVLYLSSAGSFNYGHWLIDDLPRLKLLFDQPQPTTVLVQSFPGMDEIRRQSIEVLTSGLDVEVSFTPHLEALRVDGLTYVTPVSLHPVLKSPTALDFIRSVVWQALGTLENRPRRLFLLRRPSRGRRLLNLDEVKATLLRRGFFLVDPENLSFEKQAALFAGADCIVGVMSAGMCNTLFAKPGTRTLYLVPEGWTEPFYWDLASVLGQRYAALFGRRAFTHPAPHLDDFTISLNALDALVSTMVGPQETPSRAWRTQ